MSLTTKLDFTSSAELSRILFEGSSDALLVFDPSSMGLVDVNPRALEITRLQRAELLERRLIELFATEAGASLNELLDACRSTQPLRSRTTLLLRRETEESVSVNVTVSRLSGDGQPLGLVALRAVGESQQRGSAAQKISEELLRASEAKHRALIDYAPVCIKGIDLLGRVSSMNPAGLKMLSVDDASEVIGREFLSFVVDHDRARVGELLQQAYLGRPSSFEFTCLVNGDARLFSSNFIPILNEDGEVTAITGTTQDITQRVDMQSKLLESESRFRTIFEQAAVGVALIDTHTGRFVRINQKYSELIGYGQDEMLKRTFVEISFPEDLDDDLKNMRRLHAGQISEFTMEKRLIRKDGSLVWVKLTVSPTWRPDAKPEFHIAIVEDITKSKNAELALRESEHKFRTLCKHAPMGIFLTDVDGSCNYMNETGCKIIGQLAEQSVGSGWANALHPDDRERVTEAWNTCVESTGLFEFETRFLHSDGRVVWVRARANARPDDDGNIDGHVGSLVDISQQMNTTQELIQSEHRYRSIVDNAPEAIVVLDVDSGQFVDFNESAVTIFKSTPEIFIRSGPWDFSPEFQPDGRKSSAAALDLISRALAGETVVCEWSHCDTQGREIPCDLRLTRFPDENRRLVQGSITDITQRKKAETQLRITQTAIDQNHGAMVQINSQGRFTYVNEFTCEHLGYSRDELLVMHIWDIDPHWLRETWANDWLRIKTDGSSTFRTVHKKKNGTVCPAEVTLNYFNMGGEQFVFVFSHDLTERELAEDKLRERENQLAHFSRLSTMGEMVAGIAHEVNQPLYSIVNFSKAINNTLNNPTTDDLQQVADWNRQIATAAKRAGQIIKRMRGFVSQQASSRVTINMNELIIDAIELVRYELNRGGVKLKVELPETTVAVRVDRVQVQQVLVNLLINAIESMDRENCTERRVVVTVTPGDDHVEVSISDTGIGLPGHLQSTIFDAFVSTKPGGMGMGLAISQTIIDSFHGRLWTSSKDKGGATFHFTLPVVSEAMTHVS